MADYQVLMLEGPVTFTHTELLQPMLLVVFLIYAITEQEQNQSFVLLSAQHALCSLCSSDGSAWGLG